MAGAGINDILPLAAGQTQFSPAGLGGLLPVEFQQGADGSAVPGTAALAVPSLLRGAVNSGYNALVGPGEILTGRTPTGGSAVGVNPMSVAQDITSGLMTLGQTPLGGSLPSGAAASFKGWHGTPHTFEPVEGNPFGEFRNQAIGSGEGAQVYGWGHYVAGVRDTAEEYQRSLSKDQMYIGDKPIPKDSYFYQQWLHPIYSESDDLSDAIRTAKSTLAESQAIKNMPSFPPELKADKQREIDHLQQVVDTLTHPDFKAGTGNLLHLEIRPEEHQLLHWDKLMKEQSLGVQMAVEPLIRKLHDNPTVPVSALNALEHSGENLYTALRMAAPTGDNARSKAFASEALSQVGIPGIRYYDQGSRGFRNPAEIQADINSHSEFVNKTGPEALAAAKQQNDIVAGRAINRDIKDRTALLSRLHEELAKAQNPTHNYVIFDPKDIKIVSRNGQEAHQLAPVDHDPFQGGTGK